MKNKRIFYIAEFSLPNQSAYALHVLKMCDGFSALKNMRVELLIPHINSSYSKKIKKDYILKYNYKIKSFFSVKKKLNFILRLIFSIKIKNYLNDKKNTLIISRSLVPSIFLAFFNIKNIVEIHTELTGVTRFFFLFTRLNLIKRNLKFIFINDYLRTKMNIKKKESIILDDAVDVTDFKSSRKKEYKSTCFYSGSFSKGKGLEIILKVAKEIPEVNFHLYGNKNTIFDESILNESLKNVHFKGYLTYSKLVKKINNYKILLMPYRKNVGVLIKNIDVSKYFSPLKMFDYLASGKIIVASDLQVYRHILKDKHNSIILKENIYLWCKTIKKLIKSRKFNFLGKNAKETSKEYSWINRAKKILKFSEK